MWFSRITSSKRKVVDPDMQEVRGKWAVFFSKRTDHHSSGFLGEVDCFHDLKMWLETSRCLLSPTLLCSMELFFFFCRQINLGSKNLQSVMKKLAKEKGELETQINSMASSMNSTFTINHRGSRTIIPLCLWIFFPSANEEKKNTQSFPILENSKKWLKC